MIKLFAYLDDYRMFSISSQIHEGRIESIVQRRGRGNETTEGQRGPIGSGNVIEKGTSAESTEEQRKSLHDYGYSLFEKKLADEGKVWHVDATKPAAELFSQARSATFVKATGLVTFYDVTAI